MSDSFDSDRYGMKLPNEFAEAWLNQSHEVLGKKLQAYCLYHVLALSAIESPAIVGGRMSLEDFEKAVLICAVALPSNQKEAAEYSATISNLFNVKAKSRLQRFLLARWHNKNKKRYLSELTKFQYYIKDFATSPKISSELKGSGNGANYILSRAGFYIYQTGATVEYTFSIPIGQLNHLSMYFSAMNSGKITFVEEMEDKLALYRNLTEEVKKREREGTL